MDKEAALNKLEEDLKTASATSPHWQQLVLQGYWYGLISWAITCAEEGADPLKDTPSALDLARHSAAEFEQWPADWLQPTTENFLGLHLSLEELNSWFSRLDTVFRDCIPTDLDIFSTLAEGEPLTAEQWERLYSAVAPIPPDTTGNKRTHGRNKTHRVHGRRGVTPLRRHKHHSAITRHQPRVNVMKLK
jgi:hypothetical protein